jgi:hypothetical protein
MAVSCRATVPVAVQFLRQTMRLPYNFSGSRSSSESNNPEFIRGICRVYFPLIESNQCARKNFFSVGKNVFEGAMIGRNVVVI